MFDRLLTRTTLTADEVFGPINIADMLEAQKLRTCDYHSRRSNTCSNCNRGVPTNRRGYYICNMPSANGMYVCSRDAGHSNDHRAHTGHDSTDRNPMYTWYNDPYEAEEARMNTNSARPTIVTTVSLDRASGGDVKVSDLKTLIAEVERVGGGDDSTVSLNNSTYRWDVALVVKANEVQTEPVLSDEDRINLLNEISASGTTAARKKEIKGLLGL